MTEARFTLFPPPRRLAPETVARLAFGDPIPQAYWLFAAAFGAIFWYYVRLVDLTAASSAATWVHATGEVVRVADTGHRWTDASSGESLPVIAVHYRYDAPTGPTRGVGYGAGTLPSPHDLIDVEYVEDRPAVSRAAAAGLRPAVYGRDRLWVALPAAAFLLAATWTARRGAGRLALLRNGVADGTATPTRGRPIRRRPAPVVRAFELVPADDGSDYELVETDSATPTEAVEPLERPVVLIDAERPDVSLTVRDCPGEPWIDGEGTVRVLRPSRGWASLALPAAAFLVHAVGAVAFLASAFVD